MKIIYVADDGTQFDNEFACTDYEWQQRYNNALKRIKFYDKNGEILTSSPLDDIHYNSVEIIVIPDENALMALHGLANYTGFCEYLDIDFIGTWKHREDAYLHHQKAFIKDEK